MISRWIRLLSVGLVCLVGCFDVTELPTAGTAARPTMDIAGLVSAQQKLTASDGVAGDLFGSWVAISGNLALVGAPGSGSAYVFERSGNSWNQVAKLAASDGAAGDVFGSSVAINGDLALVGAFGDDDNGSSSGSAYVFDGAAGWSQAAKLVPLDGAADDLFGWSVAISGDLAVVGAYSDDDNGTSSGSAYVFDGSLGWSQVAKLTPSDGSAGDVFGFSVAISGGLALVGAYGDDLISGSAYVFDRSLGWSQVAKLTPSDGSAGDFFGISVGLSGDRAIAGAMGDADNGAFSGSAYLFDGSSGWSQVAKLTASDGAASDFFGRTVAISGDVALVGAHGDNDNGSFSGSAYVFDGAAGWSQAAKLIPSDGKAGDQFGLPVALSGDLAVVGTVAAGSAYIFGTPPPEDVVDEMIGDVDDLVVASDLNQGQGSALTIKLDKALERLAAGQEKVAINLLNAFINQVQDYVATGVLGQAQGRSLIEQAEYVIGQLTP